MAADSPAGPTKPVHICLLYSGFFLNAAFLQFAGDQYFLLYSRTQFALVLLVASTLLIGGVFYAPARLGASSGLDLSGAVQLYLGRAVSLMVNRALVPLWACTLFLYIGMMATISLDVSLFHSERPSIQPGLWRGLLIGLFWFVVIVPGVKDSLTGLARTSPLLAKASLAAIVGLALSTSGWWGKFIDEVPSSPPEVPVVLGSVIMLWAAPALLLVGTFTRNTAPPTGQRSILLIGTVIGLGLVFALVIGLFTLAGAAMTSVRFRKVPDYILYAYMRPHQLGWMKLLALCLTMILSARFLLNVVTRSLRSQPGWFLSAAVTGVLLGTAYAVPRDMAQTLWTRAAIPFPALGAVLTAAHLTRKGAQPPTATDRAAAASAWMLGCIVCTLPLWVKSIGDYYYVRMPWAIQSWLCSFGLTAMYFLVKRVRSSRESR
jgi:hypothetical protein